MAMATATGYRVEVSVRDLPQQQMQQFIESARDGGYTVDIIHNGWTVVVTRLTNEQATAIGAVLDEFGVHYSIGIQPTDAA
jgi:hypothetical protein